MAEEKVELRDLNLRQLFPWTELFRGFQVAMDPKKLLLAAAGIAVMAFGWWALAAVFFSFRSDPTNIIYSLDDYKKGDVSDAVAQQRLEEDKNRDQAAWNLLKQTAEPGGALNSWPWDEDRGPNPYLLVSGATDQPLNVRRQLLVLIEPLVKFLLPVKYLLKSEAGFWNHVYFFLSLVWALATWALFGGAITRMAAVQLTRKEKIGLREALRFARSRYVHYLTAPLFPMLFVLGILVLLTVFGLFHMIPVVGDILVDGLGWPLVLLAGIVMAVILAGLVGWPMMYATISTEGSDNFDALSRSYSYLFQCPRNFFWYSAVAVAYGAVLVFFVGFMGSFMVYLGKWGVSQTPFLKAADREPSYLFVYAPESYGWRQLLLEGAQVDGMPLVGKNGINPEAYAKFTDSDHFRWYNQVGAAGVSFWLTLLFLMVVGFGYSYFWSASTIIYLLMRRHVDDTDLDEVYLEEDESEDAYVSAPASPSAGAANPQTLTMVDPPKLRTPPAKAESPSGSDGNPPA